MKLLKSKLSITIVNTLSYGLVAFSPLAIASNVLAEGYYEPRVTFPDGSNRRVSKCVDSDKFQNPCTKNAGNKVAQEFCEDKGHGSWRKWNSTDVGWDNRQYRAAVWTDKYRDGERWKGWTTRESSILMMYIECN
ncbi:MAG: hypothetical protein MK105_18330 [Crocinitomicaceae bacterium]|nr:hypothetical protein [Crocinitomicaceae bacterium]